MTRTKTWWRLFGTVVTFAALPKVHIVYDLVKFFPQLPRAGMREWGGASVTTYFSWRPRSCGYSPECSQGIRGRIHPLLPHGRSFPPSAFRSAVARDEKTRPTPTPSTSPSPQKVLITLLYTQEEERRREEKEMQCNDGIHCEKLALFHMCTRPTEGSRQNKSLVSS